MTEGTWVILHSTSGQSNSTRSRNLCNWWGSTKQHPGPKEAGWEEHSWGQGTGMGWLKSLYEDCCSCYFGQSRRTVRQTESNQPPSLSHISHVLGWDVQPAEPGPEFQEAWCQVLHPMASLEKLWRLSLKVLRVGRFLPNRKKVWIIGAQNDNECLRMVQMLF